ncbi:hypothetical protein SynRS9915_00180 [Synechococcus sp. RS9915]|nr:hypothetical protein SynRS9915_00180 [Synechococcus sp. RS9915]
MKYLFDLLNSLLFKFCGVINFDHIPYGILLDLIAEDMNWLKLASCREWFAIFSHSHLVWINCCHSFYTKAS